MKSFFLSALLFLLSATPALSASINDTDMEELLAIARRTHPLQSIEDLEALHDVFAGSRITSPTDFAKARAVATATPGGDKWVFVIPNAMEWLETEAPKGDSEIQYFLGKTLLYGASVYGEVDFYFDPEKGQRWLDAAIAQHHMGATLSLAQYHMMASDYSDAEALLLRAAETGSDEAQYCLGVFYATESRIVPDKHPFAGARPALKDDKPYLDPEKSAAWWEKAAAQGNTNAMAELAVLKASNNDPIAAFAFAEKAANLGDTFSQALLGSFYRFGIGVNTDALASYQWFSIAAGDRDFYLRDVVEEHMNALAADMTEAEIDEVRQKAEAWRKDFGRHAPIIRRFE